MIIFNSNININIIISIFNKFNKTIVGAHVYNTVCFLFKD